MSVNPWGTQAIHCLTDEFILHFYNLSRLPAFYQYFLVKGAKIPLKIHKKDEIP